MIFLHHLSKRFDKDRLLLNIDHLSLPEHGLIALVGPSGCGKTTLLNILAGLDGDYEGKVEINHHYLSKNSQKNDRFRLEHMGYIMQHYGLFEEETALDNVTLPARTLYHHHHRAIEQRGLDLLKAVGLSSQSNKQVKHFSGGEKQRIAIARALINQPRIILADEPTGALDYQHKIEIMNILSMISRQCLVLVVSHDVELMKRYAVETLSFQQGKIIRSDKHHVKVATKRIAAVSLKALPKRIGIPLSFIFHQHKTSQKHHPIRSGVALFASALGLVGIGLGLMLSLTVTTYLKNNLTRAFPQQSIIIESNTAVDTFENVKNELVEQDQVLSKYKDDMSMFFNVNYEQFFPDLNQVVIASTPKKYRLDELSIRQTNEYVRVNQGARLLGQIMMPYLENDQVVLGINFPLLNLFYSALKLPERSIDALRSYITHTGLSLAFELSNTQWQYEDEQIVEVREVVFVETPKIFHISRDWNRWFLVEQMRFPTALVNRPEDLPWMLYEQLVINTHGPIIDFITTFNQAGASKNWVFETFTPIEAHDPLFQNERLKVYYCPKPESMKKLEQDIENISDDQPVSYWATNQGYRVFKDALLSGFANPFILSTSEAQIDSMLENTIFSEEMIASQWQFDPGIVFGHYLQTTRGGFDFHPLHQFPPLIGRPPVKNNEIIISTSLANKLGLSSPKMVEPTMLYGTYVLFQQGQGDLDSVQCAKRFSLSVVGFIQSDQLSLYQQPEWLDGFFRFSVGLQNNELKHQQMIWMMEDNIPIKETIHKLEKNHPDYTFASPTFDIFSTIDATMEDIQLIIFSIASISIVISLLLNSLVNFLSVNDSLYQIGLLGYLGIPGVERIKLFVVSSLLQGGQSFLMASFELVVLQQIITVILHQELGYIGSQTILLQPFIVVALFSLGISLVSSLFASYRLSRLSPIQALQAR